MKEKNELDMTKDIRGWGAGLTIMGIMHFFVPALAPAWGVALLVMGVLCLAVQHRGIYIMIGMGLMAIGVLNFLGGVGMESKFWSFYGVFQIYWGIKELFKFRKCRKIEIRETSGELKLLEDEVA